MNTYHGSEKHLEVVKRARVLGSQVLMAAKARRVEEYNKNPKRCLKCDTPIAYEKKRESKFCSSSCSASFTQRGTKRDAATKKKIREALRGKPSPYKGITRGSYVNRRTTKCVIHFKKCAGCQKDFVVASAKGNYERDTCSTPCHRQAVLGARRSLLGKKKVTWFSNPWQGEVLLESTWEVEIAIRLTEAGVKWIRPLPIAWLDESGKTRYYFPDFYLIDQNMYLDPKNPWCMNRDKKKMAAVEKMVPIVYGSKEVVMKYVEQFIGV